MSNNVHYSKILVEALKAIGIAAVVNAVLFFVLFAAKMIDPHVGVGPANDPIHVGAVVMSTVVFLAIATAIFLLLVRFTSNPARIFTWVCAIGFVLLLANPFLMIQNIPTSMGIAVDLLHVAPAYLIWRFLTRAVANTRI